MPNRVIKDSIWTSPTLAELSDFAQDQFPRWLLMADDWGCFDVNCKVIKGLCYPMRDKVTPKKIEEIKKEYFEAGLLFIWKTENREWGYFVSWDDHHNFCNKTNADKGGKRQKNRRKTPEPPEQELNQYLQGVRKDWNSLGQVGTSKNKMLSFSCSFSSSYSYSSKREMSLKKAFQELKSLEANQKTLNTMIKELSVLKKLNRPRTSSYPKEFEQLWQREWYGEKGSKKEAYQEYKKLKPDQELLQAMVNAIDNQVVHKKQKQKIPPDYFAENMPHVCRWIKKERWTDELPELKYTNGKYEPKRLTFVDKEAYDKFVNDPENQKKIKSGEIEVKFQKESFV